MKSFMALGRRGLGLVWLIGARSVSNAPYAFHEAGNHEATVTLFRAYDGENEDDRDDDDDDDDAVVVTVHDKKFRPASY